MDGKCIKFVLKGMTWILWYNGNDLMIDRNSLNGIHESPMINNFTHSKVSENCKYLFHYYLISIITISVFERK